MTQKPRKVQRAELAPPVDPYGQEIQFNGRHVTEDDYDGVKLQPGQVAVTPADELAADLSRARLEQLLFRVLLTAVIVLAGRALGIDVPVV